MTRSSRSKLSLITAFSFAGLTQLIGSDPVPAAATWNLWPESPPQYLDGAPPETCDDRGSIRGVTVPAIIIYPADATARNGITIILCAGGGYGALDWKTHVEYSAAVFNPLGVTIVGLKYRLRPPHRLDNSGIQALTLLDAKRALRLVRHRAGELGVDPTRIGIAGFSAGANLAMNLAANFDEGDPDSPDPVERESSRPDFAVGLATWHWREKTSPFSFRPESPPVFLVHATNDGMPDSAGRIGGAPIDLPRAIARDLETIGVPVRLLEFEEGAHGVGNLIPQRVKNSFPPARWPWLLLDWLDKIPKP